MTEQDDAGQKSVEVNDPLRGLWELFKHTFFHFWYHFFLISASVAMLAVFEPLAGIFLVNISSMGDIIGLAVFTGSLGGIIGALDAIARSRHTDIDMYLVPGVIRGIHESIGGGNKENTDIFYRCPGGFHIRKAKSYGEYMPTPLFLFHFMARTIKLPELNVHR